MIYYGARIVTKNGYTYQTVDISETERNSWLQRMTIALVPEEPYQPIYEETGIRVARWTVKTEGDIDK